MFLFLSLLDKFPVVTTAGFEKLKRQLRSNRRLPVRRPVAAGAFGTIAAAAPVSPLQRARRFSRQISSSFQTSNIMAQAAPDPEYTELGIKIHKFRFTLRVQRRTPTPSMTSEDGVSTTRSRTNSTASSIADSLGLLNLEPPRSRRPIATNSNWEFYPMRTSTPSSGYNSAASVSRTSSFSTTSKSTTSKRLTSTDDSAYSEVYSTIEELSELADPFDPEPEEVDQQPKPQQSLKYSHQKTPSSSSTIAANFSNHSGTLRKNSTLPPKPAPRPAPPLPPRINQSRPPARPPYPSSHVKQKSM